MQVEKVAIQTRLKEFFFLSLTLVYLGLVFYKTSVGADTSGLLAVAVIIFVLYLPLQSIVADHQIPIDFHNVFSHSEITKLLTPLILMAALAAIFVGLEIFDVQHKYMLQGFAIGMYALWWWMSDNLLDIAVNSSDATLIKMVGMLIFIVTLLVILALPRLPEEVDIWYFLELFTSTLYILFMGAIFIPGLGFKAVTVLLKTMAMASLKSLTSSKKSSSNNSF